MSLEVLRPAQKAPASHSLKSAEYAKGRSYKLYKGDSLSLLGQFPDESFDLIFADPPYFLSNGGFTCKGGKGGPGGKGSWDESKGAEEDHPFTTEWLRACKRVLKPSGSLWVSGTQHVIFSVGFAMQQLGYKLLN